MAGSAFGPATAEPVDSRGDDLARTRTNVGLSAVPPYAMRRLAAMPSQSKKAWPTPVSPGGISNRDAKNVPITSAARLTSTTQSPGATPWGIFLLISHQIPTTMMIVLFVRHLGCERGKHGMYRCR